MIVVHLLVSFLYEFDLNNQVVAVIVDLFEELNCLSYSFLSGLSDFIIIGNSATFVLHHLSFRLIDRR